MGNRNLNENEVEKVTGGIGPLIPKEGYEVDSVCYKCKRKCKKHVNPMDEFRYGMTGRATMCDECMRKRLEEMNKKNPKVPQFGEFLKKTEESTKI